jgi:hypothetical protein
VIPLAALAVAGLFFGLVLRSMMVVRRLPSPAPGGPMARPRRAACATCPAAGACQSGAVPECETRASA